VFELLSKNNGRITMNWTPEQIEELRDLFLDKGKSFRQIADLWNTTPGTIAGQCHRSGFKRARVKKSKVVNPGDKDLVKVKERVITPKVTSAKKKASTPKSKPAASVDKPLTVERLQPHHCRWPTNGDKPFVFCGQQCATASGPYCPKHTKMAHTVRQAAS